MWIKLWVLICSARLCVCVCVCVCACAHSCPMLCEPKDCSPPGSSVHGISQARVLERVGIPYCRGSSQPKDGTHVSCISGRFCTTEPPEKPLYVTLFSIKPRESKRMTKKLVIGLCILLDDFSSRFWLIVSLKSRADSDFFFFLFTFWLRCTACGILVPGPGINVALPAVEAWSPNR